VGEVSRHFSGWIEIGGNLSSSQNQPRRSKRCPLWQCAHLYAQQPNAINLHQLDLHAIRPDTYQTDHIDWGFRVDALYGMDYRFPTMKRHFHRAPP
jgi:hypothetical protein